MNNFAISVTDLSKVYRLYNKPTDRLKESLHPFRKKYYNEFFALDSMSMNILQGETVGIIGKNGSGKSTLLKIITGVLTPTKGELKVNGKVSALLELGAGFNPEMTGMENIYMNGAIMGYSRAEISNKIDDIIGFADIGEFIHQPIKTYSSGMFVRLAFAVAINVDPDILIVDEALSVGDIRFQQKCWRKINEFKNNKTTIFVTHDMGVINKFCDRVIWINEGKKIEEGEPEEISKKYQAFMTDSKLTKITINNDEAINKVRESLSEKNEFDVLGDNRAQIVGAGIYNNNAEKLTSVYSGEFINIFIKVKFNDFIKDVIVGFTIKDRLGNIIAQTNTYVIDEVIENIENGQIKMFKFAFKLPDLNNGVYTISPAVASGMQLDHVQHSWVHDAIVFDVLNKSQHQLQGYLILNDVKFSEM